MFVPLRGEDVNSDGQTDAPRRSNGLLSLLSANSFDGIRGSLHPVSLPVPLMLHPEGKPMRHVYFPAEGVVSVLASVEGADARIEVATVGREGMAGLAVFLGATQSPGDCFVQVEGHGWRMSTADLLQATHSFPDFARILQRYAHALFVQASQAAACNRAHSPVQRCARWLLMTHDRVSGDSFGLTQEFLGQMLGERRTTVSQAASTLQAQGLITYRRGRIKVLDRPGLCAASCGCYEVIRKQYALVLPGADDVAHRAK